MVHITSISLKLVKANAVPKFQGQSSEKAGR
jgi:hypothetical protein